MELREAKLIQTKNNDKIFKIETNGIDVLCWRSCEICTSDCAAWRITGDILMCSALPADKRVAQIIDNE